MGPGLTIREMVNELQEQARVEKEERERLREQWELENGRRVRAGQPPLPEPPQLAAAERKDVEWIATAPIGGLEQGRDGFDDGGGPVPDVAVESAPFCFQVDLTREIVIGPDGAAKQTLWSALAHNHSEPGYRRALKLREDYREELVARAEAIRKQEEQSMTEELAAMGQILDVDMDDPKAVRASLESDWVNIRVETVAEGPDDVRATKMQVLKHFTMLNDLYRHFCGNSMRGDASSMQLQEFEHLLALSAAIDVIRDHKAVVAIFKRVNSGRGGMAAALDEDSMSRFEFIEAILLVAKHRSTDRRTGDCPPCAECMDALCAESLRAVWDRLSAGPVREALSSSSLRRWLLRNHESMRRVFDWYCKQGSRNALFAQASVLMDEEEFIMVLEHAGFLVQPGQDVHSTGMGGRRNVVTRHGAREAFAGVQRDDDGTAIILPPSSAAASSAVGAQAQLEQLAFHEFVEAIARVGLQRWEDEAVPLERRIAWAFSVVCDLEEHLGVLPTEPLELPSAEEQRRLLGSAKPAPPTAKAAAAARGSTTSAGLAEDDAASVDAATAGLQPKGGPRASAVRAASSGPARDIPVVETVTTPADSDDGGISGIASASAAGATT